MHATGAKRGKTRASEARLVLVLWREVCWFFYFRHSIEMRSSKVVYLMSITRGVLAQSPELEARD